MKNYSKIIIVFLLVYCQLNAQSLFAENNKSLNTYTVLAKVDTIEITAEEFFYSYEFGPVFPKRQKKSKEIHLDYMINEKLLALEGYDKEVFDNEDIVNVYSDISADLATEELFRDEILSQIVIGDEEINNGVIKKSIELEIRWIYSSNENKIIKDAKILEDPTLFDSLFNDQLNDSLFADERKMNISMFNLNKRNPILANIIDTMEVGNISGPIYTSEGWYIIKYENKIINALITESERNKLRKEVQISITKTKMDSISDSYVDSILFENHPIIKRDAFNILRSYLGKYVLTIGKYNEWDLDQKMEVALNNLGISKNDKYPGIVLIESIDNNFTLDDFLFWYNNRHLYIKFSKNDLPDFSKSLENLVWLMLRDRLLTQKAKEKNYFENERVKRQSNWWKDKIAYSAMRNAYSNSISLDFNEIVTQNSNEESKSEKINMELSKKIFYKVLELKNKYHVNINSEVLDEINVSSEEDKKAINFYPIKKGGLIPRPAYPAIDSEWSSWQ